MAVGRVNSNHSSCAVRSTWKLVRIVYRCWRGGLPSRTRLTALHQEVFKSRGGFGKQVCSGGAMLRRKFDPSEPAWETGDDWANLEGSHGCSPAWHLVGSETRRMYKPAVAVFWLEGYVVEHGGWWVMWKEVGDEDHQRIRLKTSFRSIIDWSPQKKGAMQLWSPTWRFLGRASRVTAKRKKHFGGIFPKNSILSTFRVFSLSRLDVLLILWYINWHFEIFIHFWVKEFVII